MPAQFDSSHAVEHSRGQVTALRRMAAVLLSLALVAGNAAVCAGWAATPEERMACCAEGGECPMHKGRSDESGSERVMTQAQADACCAASERDQSNSSNPTAVAAISAAVLGAGLVLPAISPSLVVTDGWRTDAPIHRPPVPRHVLLSVFLL
jgi:hypothetical protein